MKNRKFFTIGEAEQLIGLLETTLERIRRNRQEFLWLKGELSILELIVECGASEKNPDAIEAADKRKRVAKLAREIERDIASIEETGCILREVEEGVVDFLSVQDGAIVLLCWKKGEESIQYWHSTGEGFAGRHPLARSSSKS